VTRSTRRGDAKPRPLPLVSYDDRRYTMWARGNRQPHVPGRIHHPPYTKTHAANTYVPAVAPTTMTMRTLLSPVTKVAVRMHGGGMTWRGRGACATRFYTHLCGYLHLHSSSVHLRRPPWRFTTPFTRLLSHLFRLCAHEHRELPSGLAIPVAAWRAGSSPSPGASRACRLPPTTNVASCHTRTVWRFLLPFRHAIPSRASGWRRCRAPAGLTSILRHISSTCNHHGFWDVLCVGAPA